MAFLLGKKLHKHRSPEELVKVINENLQQLTEHESDSHREKTLEKLARFFGELKLEVLGDGEGTPQREVQQVVTLEACRQGLPMMLCAKLPQLEFETRKDAAAVFGQVLRTEYNGQLVGLEYVKSHQQILSTIIRGYQDSNIALISGVMVRDCTRHEELAQLILAGPLFDLLYGYVELENFEVASDAFQTMKDILTRHKRMVAEHLQANYDIFFSRYTALLKSQNYVTRRQSLKLLGELLLDRCNVKVMLPYVSQRENLVLMMNLLKDGSRSIQFEAFHVFKVFVANPQKPPAIADILIGNKEKLLLFLRDFHSDKDDEAFKEEKSVIMKEISMLGVPPGSDHEAE